MGDEELIARLRKADEYEPLGHDGWEAADRIEQLAATNEALVKERDEAIRRRDAWKSKAEGYDAVRKALREKVGAPWPPNLSRALWAGIAADEKNRAEAAEAEVEKLREALQIARVHVANNAEGWSVSRAAARVDLTIVDAAITEATQ